MNREEGISSILKEISRPLTVWSWSCGDSRVAVAKWCMGKMQRARKGVTEWLQGNGSAFTLRAYWDWAQRKRCRRVPKGNYMVPKYLFWYPYCAVVTQIGCPSIFTWAICELR
jgi:hypothetical protein